MARAVDKDFNDFPQWAQGSDNLFQSRSAHLGANDQASNPRSPRAKTPLANGRFEPARPDAEVVLDNAVLVPSQPRFGQVEIALDAAERLVVDRL